MLFRGIITALVTPFQNGEVDFPSLEKLVLRQLKDGVEGFVVNGTTGESPCLKGSEVEALFKKVREWTPRHLPVLVGTGMSCTRKTVEWSQAVDRWGPSGLLVVTPAYNKPPQRGLELHFSEVARAVKAPLVLYNVPGRTAVSLEPETALRLSRHPQIRGLKEASGDLNYLRKIKSQVPADFALLSGDDETWEDFRSEGGHGVISVASHVIPQAMKGGETKKHLDLVRALFSEANPIPVKMALHLMGLIESPELRPPLVELRPDLTENLKRLLSEKRLC